MSDDRKKPLWPWIVTLLIGLPVLYVASFGPACWIVSRFGTYDPERVLPRIYQPIGALCFRDPGSFLFRCMTRYAMLGIPVGKPIIVPIADGDVVRMHKRTRPRPTASP